MIANLRQEADTASENLEKAKDLLDEKNIEVVLKEKAKFVKPESTDSAYPSDG